MQDWHTVTVALCLLCHLPDGEAVVPARVGGVADLHCNSRAPPGLGPAPTGPTPPHVVEWLRQGYNVPILIKFGVHAPRVHPAYEGRAFLVQETSLHLEGLQLEDEGWFECRILQLDKPVEDSRNGSWIFLSVTAPPVFIKTPPPAVEVLQGDSLSLTCSGHGNPPPVVTWSKGHMDTGAQKWAEVPLNVLNGTLSFVAVAREAAGDYTCIVANTEGEVKHSTQLRVKGPPIILTPPEDTALNMSQDALLRCQAEADPPNMTYVWWKDGVNVHHMDSLKSRVKILVDGTLLIHRLLPEDAGNYTCMPTNGLKTPPTASAYLTVKHPAQALQMPEETYLPTGMGGRISCTVRAQPPLLHVSWSRDGEPLDLTLFPGWTLDSRGAVVIAASNDNALGVYTCTPYNSYGTMGQSTPTTVVLQEPPVFSVAPQEEYREEVGRELILPCQADSDRFVNITWRKVESSPRSPYSVAPNGSLVLRPLSKDHQGAWECRATNRVAAVGTVTQVYVLGTSPHTVHSVSVFPGIDQANVSWIAGFDGGYPQKFTVWLKQGSTERQEWTSLVVPSPRTSLQVMGLLPSTSYQFSILPQNQMGTGPFSDIIGIKTLDPPLVPVKIINLAPPTTLIANQSSSGVVLHWSPPLSQSSPISGFVLQAKPEEGDWFVLDRDISPNVTLLLVQGLQKDCSYELRMFSRQDDLVGEPSESVNISTRGMEVYPAKRHLEDLVPEPLLAGVAGGVVFLSVAILLSLGLACAVRNRRKRRRRKRREDLHIALHKSQLAEASLPQQSPDSILKMKLSPGSSSPSHSHHSSFDKTACDFQDHDQEQCLLSSPPPRYTFPQSLSGGLPSRSTALESISRGPDGRFVLHPLEKSPATTPERKSNSGTDFMPCSETGSRIVSQVESLKSDSSCSDKDQDQKTSPIFTVDQPIPTCRVRVVGRNSSHHGGFYQDFKQGQSEGLLDQAHSDGSEEWVHEYVERFQEVIPVLGTQDKDPIYMPLEKQSRLNGTSSLVIQMEHERERGNLSKCLKLAREREELERQLEQYAVTPRARAWKKRERWREREENWPVWKLRNATLPGKNRLGYHVRSSDTLRKKVSSSAYILQDVSPLTSVTSLVPVKNPAEKAMSLKWEALSQTGDCGWDYSQSSLLKYSSHSQLSRTSDINILQPEYINSREQGSPNEISGYGRPPPKEAECCTEASVHSTELGPIYHSQHLDPRAKAIMEKNNVDEVADLDPPWCHITSYPESSPKKSIVEYLSLPGFVEMSVDEPAADSATACAAPCCLLRGEPDVVPHNWDVHAQECCEKQTDHLQAFLSGESLGPRPHVTTDMGPFEAGNKSETGHTILGDLANHHLHKNYQGLESVQPGSGQGMVLQQSTKQETHVSKMNKCPLGGQEIELETSENSTSRICKSPLSFMKEILNDASQQSGSELNSPDKCSSHVFLDPNAWVDSLSRNQTSDSPFSFRPVTDSQIQRECPITTEQKSSSHCQQNSKWPINYLEVRNKSSASIVPSRLDTGTDHLTPPDSGSGPSKSFLPRGYSWPSRYKVFFPHAESESEGEGEQEDAEMEVRDRKEDKEERDSFASQSSGRGSLGPLSAPPVSPTLSRPGYLNTPRGSKEFDEELDIQSRSRSRKTSVDESYEWDTIDCSTKVTGSLTIQKPIAGGRGMKKAGYPRSLSAPQSKAAVLSVANPNKLYSRDECTFIMEDDHIPHCSNRRRNSYSTQDPSTACF